MALCQTICDFLAPRKIKKKKPVFTNFFTLRSSLHRSTAKCVRSSTRSSTKKGMFLRIMSSSRSSTEKSYFYTPSLPSVHPPKYEFRMNNLTEFVIENQWNPCSGHPFMPFTNPRKNQQITIRSCSPNLPVKNTKLPSVHAFKKSP